MRQIGIFCAFLFLISGCMEPATPNSLPPVPATSLSSKLQALQHTKHSSIASLAQGLADSATAASDAPDRETWNKSYTAIVASTITAEQALIKDALDACKTPEDRKAFWSEIAKGFK